MKYQPHVDFSAQSSVFRALQVLYSSIDEKNFDEHEFLPLVVFAAFSIEAYVNAIGARKIKFWDQIERSRWKNKIEILHVDAGKSPDWGSGNLQFATEIFHLRDLMAHGKPERVDGPLCDKSDEASALLWTQSIKPSWFKKINLEWARSSNAKVCNLLRYLGSLYDLPEDDFVNYSQSHISRHEE